MKSTPSSTNSHQTHFDDWKQQRRHLQKSIDCSEMTASMEGSPDPVMTTSEVHYARMESKRKGSVEESHIVIDDHPAAGTALKWRFIAQRELKFQESGACKEAHLFACRATL